MAQSTETTFQDLNLSPAVLKALNAVGYETPSPIQAATIPLLLEGHDVIGQAQTGTGKTAAFALPLLSRLIPKGKGPQIMVLAPTRELAIQVAEAFQKYAQFTKGFHVLPIYGGQDYSSQIRALRRGVQVVVGTPGRVIDHMKRGTLSLANLTTLVLDEADEMLRMGFIDDVEWVLEQCPEKRQIALFSATMPEPIKRIAERHLKNPSEVRIKNKTATASTIAQRYWPVSGTHKLDALTRILEAEPFEGVIVFVRTKTSTVDLAEKLAARGHAAAPLNGDIPQKQRERTVERLKSGKLDIIVATDVAARGLDVERISHVINYDIPHDTEAYIHRIGRTGRAGREGDAILFVAPREKRMLFAIEKATRKKIELMQLPSTDLINEARVNRFKQRIADTIEVGYLDIYLNMLKDYQSETGQDPLMIAAALARLTQGDAPLLLKETRKDSARPLKDRPGDDRPYKSSPRKGRGASSAESVEAGMERYRIDVGHQHNVQPGNIVGAIANEADISSRYIGRISINDDHSLIDLPESMPKETLHILRKTRVAGQKLNIRPASEKSESFEGKGKYTGKSGKSGKPKKPGKKFSKPGGFKKASGKPGKAGKSNKTRKNKGYNPPVKK